nr:ankyrin repeat domain-containing protein [Legionella yabuuchiae]
MRAFIAEHEELNFARDEDGNTALIWAACKNSSEAVKAILESPQCDSEVLKAQNNDGYSALMWATKKRNSDAVNAILASPHCNSEVLKTQDYFGNTAFQLAQRKWHHKIAREIAKHDPLLSNLCT